MSSAVTIIYTRPMREKIDTKTIQADFDRIALLSSKTSAERWNHNNRYHRFLLEQVPTHCRNVLEIGCGGGEFARLLAQRAEHVLALDLSPQMIQQAYKRSEHFANIDYQVADALSWKCPPEQFDYIVSIATLHHLPREEILSKMKAALAPGGTLVVLDLYAARFPDLFGALATIPADLLMQLLKNRHRPKESQEARQAWVEHGKHDSYLGLWQVHQSCRAMLPGAKVRRHLFWRYSIFWKKAQ